MDTPLIILRNVSLVYGDKQVLRDINWTIQQGEQWAIIGHNGAGKTSLLKLLRGEVRPYKDFSGTTPEAQCLWCFAGTPDPSPLAVRPISSLLSSELQRHYVRQRWQLRGEDVILSGLGDGYMLYDAASQEEKDRAYSLAAQLGATALLNAMAPELSQGQLRLLLLCRALLKEPKLLLLDEPADGLDATTRGNLYHAVESVAQRGCTVICAIHRDDDVPQCITHVLELEEGRITYCGPKQGGHDTRLFPAQVLSETHPTAVPHEGNIVFSMRHADVFLQHKPILHSIDWEVRTGEQWLLSGPNGSGKSTLLRVLLGQEHVALGGSLSWFGLSGQPTLEERQRYTGYVSDWLRNNYQYDLTGRELVLSGLHGTIGLYRESTLQETEAAQEILDTMGLAAQADKRFEHMSEGTARRFLLARATVSNPKLLILDEPCSGLDADSRVEFMKSLPYLLHRGVQLIFVSHSKSDLRLVSGLLTHELRLTDGQIAFCGPIRKDA